MLVRMNLARIVIVEADEMSMIVLQELDGKRAFPILIGIHEAYAIDRRTRGVAAPRPMTHDLFDRMMAELDCHLEQIVISALKENTFFAKLVLRCDGRPVEIDSRPSDAIAVAAGTDTPIFVDDSILKEVC